jgi:hypothetical protein
MLTKEASIKSKNRSKREGNKRSQKWLTNEKFIKKTNQTISKNGYKEKQTSKRKINQKRRKTNEAEKSVPKETCIKTKIHQKMEEGKTVD